MKCSMLEIDAGNAAVAFERDRLQRSSGGEARASADPFLRAPPKAPEAPDGVEMLVEGLREVERATE